jgi:hypothetical protein
MNNDGQIGGVVNDGRLERGFAGDFNQTARPRPQTTLGG